MFDKLYIFQARDALMNRFIHMKHKILEDSTNRFSVSVKVKDRDIEVRLTCLKKNSVTVDVIDPFGIIRIPRTTFKKLDDFRVFILTDISKIVADRV